MVQTAKYPFGVNAALKGLSLRVFKLNGNRHPLTLIHTNTKIKFCIVEAQVAEERLRHL